jgi:hypothetical protein
MKYFYSVSRILEAHLGSVWGKGKGKREKAVSHGSENCRINYQLSIK